MKKFSQWFLIGAVILGGTTGCTMTIKPPAKPFSAYPAAEKKNLKVGLVLSDELKKTQAERKALDGTKFVVPIGPNLAMNAEALSKKLFTTTLTASNPSSFAHRSVDAILTPRVDYFNYMNVAGVVAIKLEWTFTRPDGQVIWAGTATGEGKQTTIFLYDPKDTVREAIDNLFADSFKIISQAPEIRNFQP